MEKEEMLERLVIWLVVSTILNNISQWEGYPIYYGKKMFQTTNQ
jgi:hypothetical protein